MLLRRSCILNLVCITLGCLQAAEGRHFTEPPPRLRFPEGSEMETVADGFPDLVPKLRGPRAGKRPPLLPRLPLVERPAGNSRRREPFEPIFDGKIEKGSGAPGAQENSLLDNDPARLSVAQRHPQDGRFSWPSFPVARDVEVTYFRERAARNPKVLLKRPLGSEFLGRKKKMRVSPLRRQCGEGPGPWLPSSPLEERVETPGSDDDDA